MSIDGDIKLRRAVWFDRQESTIQEFAKRAGLEYNTAYMMLTTARIPRKPYRKTLLKAFPDFPIK